MNVLGLSCHYHDSAAALVSDGVVVAAAQEERFDRQKGSPAFPIQAINACLQAADITIADVDRVAFYEKPFLKFERVLFDHVRSFPFTYRGFMRTLPSWLSERLTLPLKLKADLGYVGPTLFVPHHLAHAASAFFASPFDEAAILTVDGVGEWATTTWGTGRGRELTVRGEITYPDSLGLLYSAITTYLGFAANRGEGKVMALADLGEPVYLERLREIVTVRPDGSFSIDRRYFPWTRGATMYGRRFVKAFGPPREPGSELEQRHRDMAASLQRLLEETLLAMSRHAHTETGAKALCIAGGVGLNCVANDRILEQGPFDDVWVQPAAGDSGAALGAAAWVSHVLLGAPRGFVMTHAALGPDHPQGRLRRTLVNAGARFDELEPAALVERAARAIADGKIVGWFQGRMEFGPRALGHRSILADPRAEGMKDLLNARIKHREGFRPYGASVLEERVGDWFEAARPSPFMLFAFRARPERRAEIPSALHVNGTCRIQTVSREADGLYYDLVRAFEALTGVPMVINTSFNDNQEPIVCTPEDAWRCFAASQMDHLVLGPYFVEVRGP